MEDKSNNESLDFLKKCKQPDLKMFADCLRYGNDKKDRPTQELTKNKTYNDNKERLVNAVDVLIDEFEKYGGSTVVNTIRRHGVSYKTILTDICKRLYVFYSEKMPIMMIERNLIMFIMEKYLTELQEEEINNLFEKWCGNSNETFPEYYSYGNCTIEEKLDCLIDYAMSRQNLRLKTMPLIMKEVEALTTSKDYKGWLLDIFNQSKSASSRNFLGFFNKVIHGIAYPVVGLQGPAYRVTFPCTLMIIYMRIKYMDPNI
jgi:hypothetical protein